MKSKTRSRSSKTNTTVLYLVVLLFLLVIVYLLYTEIIPQLASLSAGAGNASNNAISSSSNATKTAVVNFVYVK